MTITNIYLNNDVYDTIARTPDAKEVLIYLPKNWSLELNGFGGRNLLDQYGNVNQIITEKTYRGLVPVVIDKWGNKQTIRVAA